MLSRIPTISTEGLVAYFDTINSKLTVNENLKYSPLLELAIWKMKFSQELNPSGHLLVTEKIKMQCRTDSVSIVHIIVPCVMSLLTDGDYSAWLVDDWNNEDGEDESVELTASAQFDDQEEDISNELLRGNSKGQMVSTPPISSGDEHRQDTK